MPHIHEKIDFTVEVFIVHHNKVLLRKHDKYKIWLSVGGHIELDENPNQAAIREVKEEVGLDITLYDGNRLFKHRNERYEELIPPFFMNIHSINETHRHVCLTYFAHTDHSNIIIENQDDKSDEWKWLTKEEVEDMEDLKSEVRIYALKALEVMGDN